MDKLSEKLIFDGFEMGLGLNMPTTEDVALMAQVSVFPENMIYDPKDIQKFLGNDRWKYDESQYSDLMRNQETDGSCNTCANATGVEIGRKNQGFEHIELSHSFLYSLKEVSGGQDRGCTLPSTFAAINFFGISPIRIQVGGMTRQLPNTIYSTRTPIPADVMAQAKIEAQRFRGVSLVKVPTDNFEKFKIVMATMLARKIPVVWAWHVGRNGSRIDGNGYMICEGTIGNHANVLVSAKWVGGSDLVHPVNMNSWGPTKNPLYGPKGPNWGRGGFAFATMEQAFSCAHIHQPYGVISVSADPSSPFFNGVFSTSQSA